MGTNSLMGTFFRVGRVLQAPQGVYPIYFNPARTLEGVKRHFSVINKWVWRGETRVGAGSTLLIKSTSPVSSHLKQLFSQNFGFSDFLRFFPHNPPKGLKVIIGY